MIYDVLLRKEFDKKPGHYHFISGMRDGIECLNFFLDLINHIAGYSEKYYNEHLDQMNHE